MRTSRLGSPIVACSALFALIVGTTADVPGLAFDRFITIWLENQDFSKVSADGAFGALAKEGIELTSYYGLTHPSQPNYIASVGGDYFGLDNDGVVQIPENVSTVVDLFDTKNIAWKEYLEDIPGPGYMGESTSGKNGLEYVRKHNPLISYDSVMMNGSRLASIQSFASFQRDLTAKTLPQYFHMSPNMLNDGHDTSLGYATKWAESYLPPLLENEYFMNRTLILLTYDESETYKDPNHIASLLLGGAVPENMKGTKDDTFYTHYSILSTLQNNWDLPNLGRYDVGANVFDLVTKSTGWQNQQVTVPEGTNLSHSYPGYLNSKNPGPIPPPNKKLTGAGGQGILPAIEVVWRTDDATPYDGSGKVFDGDEATPTSAAPATNTVLPTKSVTPLVGAGAESSTTAKSGGIETIGVEKRSVGSIMALWMAVFIIAVFWS